MLSIQELLNKREKPKFNSERNEILAELLEMSLLENKVENYCRYKFWLKKNKGTPDEFKKAKLPKNLGYIKPITKKYFAIKLAHIPTKDLYYLKSMKNDYKNRNGYKRCAFTKWLFFNIKPQ